MNKLVYIPTRPALTVESVGGTQLGQCFHEHVWKVTSRNPLGSKQLHSLVSAGFIPAGQSVYTKHVKSDGTRDNVPAEMSWREAQEVKPTFHNTVKCTEIDERTGNVVNYPVVKCGKELSTDYGYFVYEVITRIDSGD